MINKDNSVINGDSPEVNLTQTKSVKKTTDNVAKKTQQPFSRSVGALFGQGYYMAEDEEPTEEVIEEVEILSETDSIIKDLLSKIVNKTDVISKTPTQLSGYKDITSPTIRKALIDLLKLFVADKEEINKVAVINEIMQKLGADKMSDEYKKGFLNNIKNKSNAVNDSKI